MKVARERCQVIHKGRSIRITADSSAEILRAKKIWKSIFYALKVIANQLHQGKLTDIVELKEMIICLIKTSRKDSEPLSHLYRRYLNDSFGLNRMMNISMELQEKINHTKKELSKWGIRKHQATNSIEGQRQPHYFNNSFKVLLVTSPQSKDKRIED